MNKNYMVSLIAVITLFLIAYVGTQQGAGLQMVFGIIVPYLAIILFIVGFARRVMGWRDRQYLSGLPPRAGSSHPCPGSNRPKSTTRLVRLGLLPGCFWKLSVSGRCSATPA